MFLRNTQKEVVRDRKGIKRDKNGNQEMRYIDVGPISYEGYEFTLPANSVCCIWDEAGRYFIEKLYKIESRQEGAGIPGILEATEEEWDGSTFAHVSRFKVISRNIGGRIDALNLAEKRGVPPDVVSQWRDDKDMPLEDIIKEINNLPIDNEIKFPIKKPKLGRPPKNE